MFNLSNNNQKKATYSLRNIILLCVILMMLSNCNGYISKNQLDNNTATQLLSYNNGDILGSTEVELISKNHNKTGKTDETTTRYNVPPFSQEPYYVLNNNVPFLKNTKKRQSHLNGIVN